MDRKTLLLDWIDTNKRDFHILSDLIWENPELSMQEYFAAEQIIKLLEEKGFTVQKAVSGLPTAFIATYGSGRPVVGFSSEYDALPGLSQKNDSNEFDPIIPLAPGHGCGHNLLAATGIMAATALKNLMDKENITGTIKVFGTPAEELCIGKPFMAKDGFFNGVDAFFDWHPSHQNKCGACYTNAYFNVKYHFKGKTAHGNSPWQGISAMDSAMLMAHGIELLREHIKPGPEEAANTINYSFPESGNNIPNVVPDKATLWCVARLNSTEMAKEVLQKVNACAAGSAMSTGTELDIEILTATHNMIPNIKLSSLCEENLRFIGLPQFTEEDQKVVKALQSSMNADKKEFKNEIVPIELGWAPVTDASEYSWHAPIALINLAVTPSPDTGWHNWVSTRVSGSDIGKKVMVVAAKTLSCSAYDLIVRPEILDEATAEFRERLGGRVYESLIPVGTVPDLSINSDIMRKFRR